MLESVFGKGINVIIEPSTPEEDAELDEDTDEEEEDSVGIDEPTDDADDESDSDE